MIEFLAPYQRAPTLMAGSAGGIQGQVEVWSPEIKKVKRRAIGLGVLVFFYAVFICLRPRFIFVLPSMIFMIFAALLYLRALKRPCYLTTDDAGIGITTWKGSKALRWSEVRSIEVFPPDSGMVRLMAPERVDIRILGYDPEKQRGLVDLIVLRAGLWPHPKKKRFFVRPDDPALTNPSGKALSAPGQIIHEGPKGGK